MITHDLGVVADTAHRIQVMYAGQIIERGITNEIFYESKHPYTWHYFNQYQGWIQSIRESFTP